MRWLSVTVLFGGSYPCWRPPQGGPYCGYVIGTDVAKLGDEKERMSPTSKQSLGDRGEQVVAKTVRCPGCKRPERTFRTLPPNFKCADVVCDFCGYLAQVKAKSVKGALPDDCPRVFPGAAWGPQRARMEAGIYFSLYLVLENEEGAVAIWFLPRDLQNPGMFVPRAPLSATARRAGWQGFTIETSKAMAPPVLCVTADAVDSRRVARG